MKKIIKIVIFLLLFTNIKNVKAETFYEDNWINGIYSTYIKEDYTKSQLMRFIRRHGDNKFAYCLTPSKFLYDNEHYQAYFNNQDKLLNITKSSYKRISLIAYYGYGYKNHKDNKWYAITQYMLWKEIDNKADIFFTDKFKGNRINKFETEIKEIESLISKHDITPNIGNLSLGLNRPETFNDKNGVLNNYNIEYSKELEIKKIDNKIIIKPTKLGNYTIKFIKKDMTYGHSPILYKAKEGQDVFITGNFEPIEKEINVNVTSSDLQITKVDSETLSVIPTGEGVLEGAEYNLYDSNNNFVDKMIIDENSKATVNNLKYGNYKLKEVEAPVGYELDKNTYNIKIDSEKEQIILKEDVIKSNITITKFASNNGNFIPENNIKFSLYDSNNNYINTFITNDKGVINFELPYGKYKVKQETAWLGYSKSNDFFIEVKDTNPINLNLVNNKIKANLKIIKKDRETHKNIVLSNAYFKIKDTSTNKYIYNVINNKKTNIFKTNEMGILLISIDGGSYELEEVRAPDGYIKGEKTKFILDENSKLIDNTIEIEIYNNPIKRNIKVVKQGKLLNNNFKLLNNVEFNIYAYEDIIAGDKTIYYNKDELVEKIKTNIDGIAFSKLLPLGKYYIIETKTNDNFIIDKQKYIIDLNENSLNTKVINLINNEKNITSSITKSNIKNNSTKKTIYPKTSNKDIYINTIVTYLIFIGICMLISGLKHEK